MPQRAPQPTAEDRLVAFAVLKANWDALRQSYIEGFLPFVMECAYHDGRSEVPIADLRTRLDQEFGFAIPDGVVRRVLDSAFSVGLGRTEPYRFIFARDDLALFDTTAEREQLRREQRALVRGFRDFATERDVEVGEDEAELALIEHVAEAGSEILLAAVGRSSDDTRSRARSSYLAGLYIEHVLAEKPDAAAYLERLVVGSMIANAVHMGATGEVERPFEDLIAFIDTPIVIDLLGRAGPVLQAAARESVRLLNVAGASIACFPHTVTEASNILFRLADSLDSGFRKGRPPSFGSVEEYAISQRLSSSDVIQWAHSVEDNLRRIGVRVIEPPPHTTRTQKVDEPEAMKAIIEAVHRDRPNAERAAAFDLDSLMATLRVRGERSRRTIEAAGAVFLTQNRSLVGVSRRLLPTEQHAPIAMVASDLVTLAWLKVPREGSELARLRLAADAYAASKPSRELIGRFTDVLVTLRDRGTVSDADVHELRYGMEAHAVLMRKVHVEERPLNEPTVVAILEETRRVLTESVEASARVEAESLRVQLQREAVERRRAEEALANREPRERLLRIAVAVLLVALAAIVGFAYRDSFNGQWHRALAALAAVLCVGGVAGLLGGRKTAGRWFVVVGVVTGLLDFLLAVFSDSG